MVVDAEAERVLDAAELNRLKWRCRRGLLENDLFIERFFRNHETRLTTSQAQALLALMDLADNDLLDLLLVRKELAELPGQAEQADGGLLEAPLHTAAAEVLKMLRSR